MKYILLASGGAAGTLLRYYLINAFQTNGSALFPWGTFSVNLIGSLIIGLVAGMFVSQTIPEEWRLFVFAGLLGGFTTFSSLAIETFYLIRSGHFLIATIYMFSTNIAGLLLAIGGFYASRKILLHI